jgi:hypothetical protein
MQCCFIRCKIPSVHVRRNIALAEILGKVEGAGACWASLSSGTYLTSMIK